MNPEVQDLVRHFQLEPHPEGGYYLETYRSELQIDVPWKTQRNVSTAIYYLLTKGDFSAFHRIRSDELWHHYQGGPATIHILHPSGGYQKINLGKDYKNGELPQALVPAGAWFATLPGNEAEYVFTGCTVAPGFDFQDFEMAERNELVRLFPTYQDLITQLTRS